MYWTGSGGYGDGMPRNPQITVEEGTSRASRTFDRQEDSEARAQAKREGAELIVQARDGSGQRRDSHGADDPAKKD